MKVLNDLMKKNGVDLIKIRNLFFSTGDNCQESIEDSKKYIISMCELSSKSIFDLVYQQSIEIENDKELSDYQKNMFKSSLILAWEELERDNEKICLNIHKKSTHHKGLNN